MSPGNRYVGNVCSTMDWWWMDRALILHSMHHKSILKHSKTYAKPALLSYVAACPLYKNVRCVIFLQMHNIVQLICAVLFTKHTLNHRPKETRIYHIDQGMVLLEILQLIIQGGERIIICEI